MAAATPLFFPLDVLATVDSACTCPTAPGAIASGSYKSPDGKETCTVTNLNLPNKSTKSSFSCFDKVYNVNYQLSVVTGKITFAHPHYNVLKSAGIPSLGSVNDYTWGIYTNTPFSANCILFDGTPIGAQSTGKQVLLS